jgi:uncharacterized protein
MPDRIITELELIERYARARQDENHRFRSYLKRLELRDAQLDTVVRDTADEVMEQIDCTTCGNCCRTMHVTVDQFDIERLAKRLGMKPHAFEKKYVVLADDREKLLSRVPCAFLDGTRCSVYEDRPSACRDFPYLHVRDFRERTLMMVNNAALCPIVYNTLEQVKPKVGFQPKRKR